MPALFYTSTDIPIILRVALSAFKFMLYYAYDMYKHMKLPWENIDPLAEQWGSDEPEGIHYRERVSIPFRSFNYSLKI